MSQYMTYVVSQGDTLDVISQSQLGSDQVDQIIAFNVLRYPYVSDNPYDQYAQPKGTLQISGPVNSGALSGVFGNPNALVVNQYDTIFFQDQTTGLYESVVAQTVSTALNGNVTITFQTALLNSYTLSSVVTDFINQQNVITQVLQTGSILYLPATVSNIYSLSTAMTDVFGTDIALDITRMIIPVMQDWATVSGVSNVQQAVVNRWQTPVGGLPGEPTYGNRMHELIGEANLPYYWSLALAFAKQSALADPRVDSVDPLTLTDSEDNVAIYGTVTAVNSPQSFVVQTSVPIGGNS